MMTSYDLIVVGAGPAGSMAARVAARFGLSVLVIERKKIVGYPSHCAGGILTLVLDHMNLTSIVKESIRARITSFQLFSPLGKSVAHHFKRKIGYIVDRPLFDQALIKSAQEKGAELLTQTRAIGLKKDGHAFNQVIIKRKNETKSIRTKIIIGADGIASNVAKWAGLVIPRKYTGTGFGYNAENVIDIPPETIELYFLSFIPGGYAWIFPQGPNTANIGVGGYNTGTYMRKVFQWFVKKHPIASLKLQKIRLTAFTGGILPGSKIPQKTTFNYGMIVGDAANQINYMTGEGIRLALKCGELAGKIAVSAIQQNDLPFVHNYHNLMRRKTFFEIFLGYLLRHFLLRSTTNNYEKYIRLVSRVNLNLVFNKKRWIPLILQGIFKTPYILKILSNILRPLPPHVKTFLTD